ncbi:GNAT family N-acetyltransferase [Bacillus sp. M6-12]|uniref:GNAT family N-acetyltransferase n=1 Tax=Bacillus sp. M6-12 TaxID=2054166 RepID=UPI000C78C5CD|nr:N-acetyltransferase [Bacillus sp. M6-12]PLS15391.1 GNAT family N-acetyltransferase [Bacillus sp. M6-12]
MIESFSIRMLQPEDAEDYVRLRLKALQESPEAFAVTYEETKANQNFLEVTRSRLALGENGFTIGAFEGKLLAGVMTIVRENHRKMHHKSSLFAVYTDPEFRGRGLAKELLQQAIIEARKLNGMEQINLTVNCNNEAAKNLYLSAGFTIFGTEKRAMKDGDIYWDEDYMVLNL